MGIMSMFMVSLATAVIKDTIFNCDKDLEALEVETENKINKLIIKRDKLIVKANEIEADSIIKAEKIKKNKSQMNELLQERIGNITVLRRDED